MTHFLFRSKLIAQVNIRDISNILKDTFHVNTIANECWDAIVDPSICLHLVVGY